MDHQPPQTQLGPTSYQNRGHVCSRSLQLKSPELLQASTSQQTAFYQNSLTVPLHTPRTAHIRKEGRDWPPGTHSNHLLSMRLEPEDPKKNHPKHYENALRHAPRATRTPPATRATRANASDPGWWRAVLGRSSARPAPGTHGGLWRESG